VPNGTSSNCTNTLLPNDSVEKAERLIDDLYETGMRLKITAERGRTLPELDAIGVKE